MRLCEQYKTQSVLDYGCGKASLSLHLPFTITSYDPAITKFAEEPEPADVVVCVDVMEHVEEPYVDVVLDHLKQLTRKVMLLHIALIPAKKQLPDGRNAHITLKPVEWWKEKIDTRFSMLSENLEDNTLTCILSAR